VVTGSEPSLGAVLVFVRAALPLLPDAAESVHPVVAKATQTSRQKIRPATFK